MVKGKQISCTHKPTSWPVEIRTCTLWTGVVLNHTVGDQETEHRLEAMVPRYLGGDLAGQPAVTDRADRAAHAVQLAWSRAARPVPGTS